jgi:hypothetical protein
VPDQDWHRAHDRQRAVQEQRTNELHDRKLSGRRARRTAPIQAPSRNERCSDRHRSYFECDHYVVCVLLRSTRMPAGSTRLWASWRAVTTAFRPALFVEEPQHRYVAVQMSSAGLASVLPTRHRREVCPNRLGNLAQREASKDAQLSASGRGRKGASNCDPRSE